MYYGHMGVDSCEDDCESSCGGCDDDCDRMCEDDSGCI